MRTIVGSLLLACALPLAAQTSPSPVNPHATPEARALLAYLYSISGKYTLTGQHNYPNTGATWTDRALDLTGKYPAVFGQDFGFQAGADKDSVLARPAVVAEAIRQYRSGSIVTLTWHAVRPTDDEPVTFHDSVQGHLTDFEWRELLTPGTALHERWCAQVDVIAGYLKQLQAAGVPVLWRPYHEVNGGWFWWGGRRGKDGSAALYRQLFDRLVNRHHLNNLIWVWNANAPGSGGNGPGPYADYFPGIEYADVLSVDVYGEFQQSYHDDLVALAAGKPVALGEVGGLPSPDVLLKQPKYAWFMSWSEIMEEGNTIEALHATYDAPNTASRDDPRVAGAMEVIRKASLAMAPEPVSPNPDALAESLFHRLHFATSDKVLGIEDGDVAETLGIIRAPRGFNMLTWRPPRPTDNASDGKLTDFEWNELLTRGTALYQRWCAQVDEVAARLEREPGTLWRPYPLMNSDKFWWAGRKGIHGSAALYRQLFERMVEHHKLRNLIWVWDAAAPGFGPDGPGAYSDFFPGLLYVDALSVNVNGKARGWRRDADLARFATGKVIGIDFDGWVPDPTFFDQQTKWAWFVLSPAAGNPQNAAALRALYASPRVVALTSAESQAH